MSTTKSGAKNEIRFNLRLPSELHEKVRNRAAYNNRSLNAEVVHLLANSIQQPDHMAMERARYEYRRVEQEIETLAQSMQRSTQRRDALLAEFRDFFGQAGITQGEPPNDED